MSAKEAAAVIADIKDHIPGFIQEVLIRAEGEFLCWESVQAAMRAGFDFVIANRGCTPGFDSNNWQRSFKRSRSNISCIASTGVATRTGGDYDLIGIAWQVRWGGGL